MKKIVSIIFIFFQASSIVTAQDKKVDLSKFTPKNEFQFKTTCYAYAVGYTAMSTEYNITNNITDKTKIETDYFSPGVIASNHDSSLPWYKRSRNCGRLGTADISLNILKTVGTTLASDYKCDCEGYGDVQSQIAKAKAKLYKIKDYATLSVGNKFSQSSVDWMKNALDQKHPVILGIYQNNQLREAEGITSIHDAQPDTQTLKKISKYPAGTSNHVVCILGYDENYLGKGGYFLIKNNFSGWGDTNHLLWVPYTFILPLIEEAYYITGIL